MDATLYEFPGRSWVLERSADAADAPAAWLRVALDALDALRPLLEPSVVELGLTADLAFGAGDDPDIVVTCVAGDTWQPFLNSGSVVHVPAVTREVIERTCGGAPDRPWLARLDVRAGLAAIDTVDTGIALRAGVGLFHVPIEARRVKGPIDQRKTQPPLALELDGVASRVTLIAHWSPWVEGQGRPVVDLAVARLEKLGWKLVSAPER
jgi:hypothetical protein